MKNNNQTSLTIPDLVSEKATQSTINKITLPFFTLLLLISFASINAVLFTPALPNIANFFHISSNHAQQTITLFLIGYALGQLVYGPLANRFGRKPTLYIGICLQIFSSLLCIFAGFIHAFWLLLLGRFLIALGSGAGLKMTFTLVNECYEPEEASPKISYLMMSFAITPGLGVALGGILNTHFGWQSCFVAGMLYGLILWWLCSQLPETLKTIDKDALKFSHLITSYVTQFKNYKLVAGGLLWGSTTCFIYVFAALAPFIVIELYGMSSQQYGFANIIPPIGIVLGSLVVAQLIKKQSLPFLIKIGAFISILGTCLMLLATLFHLPALWAIFFPTFIIYFGVCFIVSNASTLAMSHVEDKSHGAAVMTFLNMGLATIAVFIVGIFPVHKELLVTTFFCFCALILGFSRWLLARVSPSN